MTRYIAGEALRHVRARTGSALPESVTVLKSPVPRLMDGDTLYVPEPLWGFNVTNDYRLHFFAAGVMAFEALRRTEGEGDAAAFFSRAGRASLLALGYIRTREKDAAIDYLIIREYVGKPLEASGVWPLIARDRLTDTLRYACYLKAVAAWQCDSLRADAWVNTLRQPDYAILGVDQRPTGFRRFRVSVRLTNKGDLAVPVALMLDGSRNDTLLRLPGFMGDTAVTLELNNTLLKAVLDPYRQVPDADESNQQFVSNEFLGKRRAFTLLALFLWDVISLSAAFGLMLFFGTFIHRLNLMFFSNHSLWTTLFVITAILIKTGLPVLLFGFNLWGLVFLIHSISGTASAVWLAASLGLASLGMYWAFRYDLVFMSKLSTFAGYMAAIAALEPFLCFLGLAAL
ncbi:MAG: hypothetical protein V1913_16335 [Fibrobacterota bacterium]